MVERDFHNMMIAMTERRAFRQGFVFGAIGTGLVVAAIGMIVMAIGAIA